MSTVPVIAIATTVASGTASASRPAPLRARSVLPRDIVPSGNTPMHVPSRSRSIAVAIAAASPLPRWIGIWPIPSRIQPSGPFQSVDFASAWIWRCGAATATAIGSQ